MDASSCGLAGRLPLLGWAVDDVDFAAGLGLAFGLDPEEQAVSDSATTAATPAVIQRARPVITSRSPGSNGQQPPPLLYLSSADFSEMAWVRCAAVSL